VHSVSHELMSKALDILTCHISLLVVSVDIVTWHCW